MQNSAVERRTASRAASIALGCDEPSAISGRYPPRLIASTATSRYGTFNGVDTAIDRVLLGSSKGFPRRQTDNFLQNIHPQPGAQNTPRNPRLKTLSCTPDRTQRNRSMNPTTSLIDR